MNTVKQVELDKNAWQDKRGWGVNPLDALEISGDFPGNLHIVSLKPGAVRGNHRHANATEWILVFGGQAKIVWKTGEATSIDQISVDNSEPTLFEIPPGVDHAIVNDSTHDMYLAVFYDSHEPDTVRCPPIAD